MLLCAWSGPSQWSDSAGAASTLSRRRSIDGVSWVEYGKQLDENLKDLVARMRAKRYKPQPLRRVYIPKNEHQMRPLGIPALEDKIVQRGISFGDQPRRPTTPSRLASPSRSRTPSLPPGESRSCPPIILGVRILDSSIRKGKAGEHGHLWPSDSPMGMRPSFTWTIEPAKAPGISTSRVSPFPRPRRAHRRRLIVPARIFLALPYRQRLNSWSHTWSLSYEPEVRPTLTWPDADLKRCLTEA
jgi:hypothetical protein